MIKIIFYMGSWMKMHKVMLVNVVKMEIDRSGYGMFSRKATLKFVTADGQVYCIKNMNMDVCAACIEIANKEVYLDFTKAIDGWIYIAEKAE